MKVLKPLCGQPHLLGRWIAGLSLRGAVPLTVSWRHLQINVSTDLSSVLPSCCVIKCFPCFRPDSSLTSFLKPSLPFQDPFRAQITHYLPPFKSVSLRCIPLWHPLLPPNEETTVSFSQIWLYCLWSKGSLAESCWINKNFSPEILNRAKKHSC